MAKKKALALPRAARKEMVTKESELPIDRQCELLGISRSHFYYESKRQPLADKKLIDTVDEIYTEWPFYGSRRIAIEAGHRLGEPVNRKRMQRVMRVMGIQAIGPKPNLSKSFKGHKVFPYLLRGKRIESPNEVWSTDITYIRLRQGYAYLTAVIDWFSRYVLSWKISNTMETWFCLKVLEEALDKFGAPEIFNTDQGSQYTSESFTSAVINSGAKMSMDGRGRALDNVFVERLWRNVKYEDIYPKGYSSIVDVEEGLETYFDFYNTRMRHQSLGYRPPAEIFGGKFLE